MLTTMSLPFENHDNHKQFTNSNHQFLFRAMSMQPRVKHSAIISPSCRSKSMGEEKLSSTGSTTTPLSSIESDSKMSDRSDSNNISGEWSTEKKLRRLGYFHPLDPSHVTFPKAQLKDILQRLTDCLRVLSCHVLYEDESLSADCLTMEHVRFQIAFFETDAATVILEVQRRAGDSYIFHHNYARPILAIIRCNNSNVQDETRRLMDQRMLLSLDQLVTIDVTDDDISQAIELATQLVTSERVDACGLGMESLEALTDTTKTGNSVAIKVAREFVVPSSETSNELVRVMLRYLLNEKDSETTYRALHVWANVFQLVANDVETSLDIFCDTICPAEILLRSLMSWVEEVHQSPHEATIALWGLAALCQSKPQLGSHISRHAVREAGAVGAARHAALELASRKVLEAC